MENSHSVKVSFDDADKSGPGAFSGQVSVKTFGKAQYQWHPATLSADPDGPVASSTLNADANAVVDLPASSITVLRGQIKFSTPSKR
jgi:hypothetical protein